MMMMYSGLELHHRAASAAAADDDDDNDADNDDDDVLIQGLNFITGLLLLVVKDEERTFGLVNTLVSNILPGLTLLFCLTYLLSCLTQ